MLNTKLLLSLQPLLLFVLFVNIPSFAQLRWDGKAGDGRWMTPGNWSGNVLPAVTDDVILDNTFIAGNYTVNLPADDSIVHVRSVTIAPGAGNTIELILPAANTALPGFKVSGAAYGMVIGNGGIFKNASGTSSGLPVEIADSLKISNGGRFIQNTEGSHAAIVAVLSRAPGTEEGIFEFDLPTASSTISLSGRTYGKLVLLSNAMNGTVTYTASGTNNITLKSDLHIGAGVTFSLNFSDTLFVGRDLIQQGGALNLGNNNRSLVTVVNRHLVQSTTGVISETGTGLPEMVFGGNTLQQIDCKGTIKDNVAVKINSAAGATLTSPWSLPYKLHLVKGKVTTSGANILKLLSGCSIIADSLSDNSFIDGPLRKEGLSATDQFLFPVGKGNFMRWLTLKNASGNFNVEYIGSNPQLISNTYGAGISYISQTGYWSILADASPSASASVELSFNGPNSGVGTNLATARVARLDNGVWLNNGNTAFTGTAGSRGSVISNNIVSWSAVPDQFALGSSVPVEGPLALVDDTSARRNDVVNYYSGALQLVAITSARYPVLTCRAFQKTQARLCVVNNNGQVVRTVNTIIERGVNRLPMEMPLLPAGVYSIYAFTPKGPSNVIRFVIIQ